MAIGGADQATLKLLISLSFFQTIIILSILIKYKGELRSESARKALQRNAKVFWTVFILLLVPLMLFIVWETLDFFRFAFQPHPDVSRSISDLRLISFSIFNLGLMGVITLLYRMLKERI